MLSMGSGNKIMVRAYGGEPCAVEQHGGPDGPLLIRARDVAEPIGWPSDHAFMLDAALYDRLRRAYEAGDGGALAALWGQAKPLETTGSRE